MRWTKVRPACWRRADDIRYRRKFAFKVKEFPTSNPSVFTRVWLGTYWVMETFESPYLNKGRWREDHKFADLEEASRHADARHKKPKSSSNSTPTVHISRTMHDSSINRYGVTIDWTSTRLRAMIVKTIERLAEKGGA